MPVVMQIYEYRVAFISYNEGQELVFTESRKLHNGGKKNLIWMNWASFKTIKFVFGVRFPSARITAVVLQVEAIGVCTTAKERPWSLLTCHSEMMYNIRHIQASRDSPDRRNFLQQKKAITQPSNSLLGNYRWDRILVS